jgi:hypothetical protein
VRAETRRRGGTSSGKTSILRLLWCFLQVIHVYVYSEQFAFWSIVAKTENDRWLAKQSLELTWLQFGLLR